MATSRSDNESDDDEDNELLPPSSSKHSIKDQEVMKNLATGSADAPGDLTARTDDTMLSQLSQDTEGPSQVSSSTAANAAIPSGSQNLNASTRTPPTFSPDSSQPTAAAQLGINKPVRPPRKSNNKKNKNTHGNNSTLLPEKSSKIVSSAPALINLIDNSDQIIDNNFSDYEQPLMANKKVEDKIVALFEDPNHEGIAEMEAADLDNLCGIGRYRPPCLQRFATKGWMLFWMCWFCLVQGMLVNGLVPSVLSTIERRFDFTTSTLGRIMQFYDIGYVICCIPVSYFGGRHSKPFFIGLGLLFMGCGSFLFSMPHIVSEAYTTTNQATDDSRCYKAGFPLTHPFRNGSGVFAPVNAGAQRMCPDEAWPKVSDKFRYAFLFCFAHFLHGVGATPLFTLGVSYIDENVKPTLSSMYIGIFYAFAIFGPAIGFLLSGTFLRFHTDFLQAERQRKITEIDESDPHWVGAWWIGFQVASILSVLAVFPILSFPKVLPGAEKWTKARQVAEGKRALPSNRMSPRSAPASMRRSSNPAKIARPSANQTGLPPTELRHVPLKKLQSLPSPSKQDYYKHKRARSDGIVDKERGVPGTSGSLRGRVRTNSDGARSEKEDSIVRRLCGDVRHIPAALKNLFLNPTFMFVNMAAAVDGLLITGLSSYMTKYLERQFNIPSSKSSVLQGCIMVPVAGLGTMASGYVVKRYRLSCENTLKFCIVMVVFCLVLTPMFLVYCDHSPLVGLETVYPIGVKSANGTFIQEPVNLKASCNNHCKCDKSEFRPVCAEPPKKSPISFYSPCFAGCPEKYDSSKKLYVNCTCVPDTGPVKKGLCEAKCSGLIGFLVLFAPMVLCTFCVGVPALSVVLRCVDYSERSFALGLQWVLIRCIGTIPAQTLFAWLFDISCVRPITEKDVLTDSSGAKCEYGSGLYLGSCFVYDNKLLADLFLAFGLVAQTGTLLFFVLALVFYRRSPGRDPIEADF